MKKVLKIAVWSAFVFYCLALIYIFVIKRLNNPTGHYGNIKEFFVFSNFIPLKTVYDYIEKIINNRINLDTAIVNLVGNLIVFLPMGCFLPFMFEKMRRFKKTILLVLGIVLFIELAQIILGLGSFDIDDIIFNVGGAMIGYALACIPFIKQLYNNIFPFNTSVK